MPNLCLTSLAVIPSVTIGRAKMQKMVTLRFIQSTQSETDGHRGVITVTLRCGESVVNWPSAAAYQLAMLCLPCHLDQIDTISCSNRCMLTSYCLIGHWLSLAGGRRWERQALATSKPCC